MVFGFFKKESQDTRKSQAREPSALEIETRLDEIWLKTNEHGKLLDQLWRHTPLQDAVDTTDTEARTLDPLSPSRRGTAATGEDPAGAAFRQAFADVLSDWQPSPADPTVPLCILSHLCGALARLVDALLRVDSTMSCASSPPPPYAAVMTCLTCLDIATRSPLNVRFIVTTGGLLTTLARLLDAVVSSLWPLAMPIAYLREQLEAERAAGHSPEAEGSKKKRTSEVLSDKFAQVALRVDLLGQCVTLVTKVVSRGSESEKARLSPTSELRTPLQASEAADACLSGGSPLAKVMSWSLIMLHTHVIHCVKPSDTTEDDDDDDKDMQTKHPTQPSACDAKLFTAILELLNAVSVVVRPNAYMPDPGVNKVRRDKILECEVGEALVQLLKWPTETAYIHVETGRFASDVQQEADIRTFNREDYSLNSLSERRRDFYSAMQLAALGIVVTLLEDMPGVLRALVELDLTTACGEAMVWHVLHYTGKESFGAIEEVIKTGNFLRPNYCRLHRILPEEAYFHIEYASDINEAPLQNGVTLLDVLRGNQPKQMDDLFDLMTELSDTCAGIRRHIHACVAKQIATQMNGNEVVEAFRGVNIDTDERLLWATVDKLEFLILDVFSFLFYSNQSPTAVTQSSFATNALSLASMLSSTDPDPSPQKPSMNLFIALHHQRDYFHLQFYCLSIVLSSIQRQFERDVMSDKNTRRRGPVESIGKTPTSGKERSAFDLFVSFGLHRILLESDVFYMSAFDSIEGKTVRDPLRYRWEAAASNREAHGEAIRTCLKQLSRYIIHSVATYVGREIRPDLTALLALLRHMRYNSVIVRDVAEALLVIVRKRDTSKGIQLHCAPILDNPSAPGPTSASLNFPQHFVNILSLAFEAQHEVVCALRGQSFTPLSAALPGAGSPVSSEWEFSPSEVGSDIGMTPNEGTKPRPRGMSFGEKLMKRGHRSSLPSWMTMKGMESSQIMYAKKDTDRRRKSAPLARSEGLKRVESFASDGGSNFRRGSSALSNSGNGSLPGSLRGTPEGVQHPQEDFGIPAMSGSLGGSAMDVGTPLGVKRVTSSSAFPSTPGRRRKGSKAPSPAALWQTEEESERALAASTDIPVGITQEDLPSHVFARNLILNVFEGVYELPVMQILALQMPGIGALLSCLQCEALRPYAIRQFTFLLKQAGEGQDFSSLHKTLNPAVNDLLHCLNSNDRTVTTTVLTLLRDVLVDLNNEEFKQIKRGPVTAGLPDIGKRKKVLQYLGDEAYFKILATLHSHQVAPVPPSAKKVNIAVNLMSPSSSNEKIQRVPHTPLFADENFSLGMLVIETLGVLMRGNVRAKQRFAAKIGWHKVVDDVLHCVLDQPRKEIFDKLFGVLLDGSADGHIENEGVLIIILQLCFHPSFATDTALVTSIAVRVKSVLMFSTHNLEKASRMGALETLISMLVYWEGEDIRQPLTEAYYRIGRHNITVRHLKPLFGALREQSEAQRVYLLPWVIRILRNLGLSRDERRTKGEGPPAAKAIGETRKGASLYGSALMGLGIMSAGGSASNANSVSESVNQSVSRGVPSAFFDFSGVNSGIHIPDAAYPSSNGYSIAVWFRVESFTPPTLRDPSEADVLGSYIPHLYSMASKNTTEEDVSAISAFFRCNRLCLSVRIGSEVKEVSIDSLMFEAQRWYHLLVTHSCGTRIIGKSETVRVFVDGVEAWKGSLRYPKSGANTRYSGYIGADQVGAQGRTLFTNLSGQISAIYFIDSPVGHHTANAMYETGPRYMGSFSREDSQKLKAVLREKHAFVYHDFFLSPKIYMLFNPLVAHETHEECLLLNVMGLSQMNKLGTHDDGSAALILKGGTQLCITQCLSQVLESIGGMPVLFPLLAFLGEHGSTLLTAEPSEETPSVHAKQETRVTPFLVSNILSLLSDLSKVDKVRFIEEWQAWRLTHVLNMLLRSIAPLLDKGNVERISVLIWSWPDEVLREGVLYLLLDFSIWVQASPAILREVLVQLVSMARHETTRKKFKAVKPLQFILEQLCWFLYYDTPVFLDAEAVRGGTHVPVQLLRDPVLRERLHGKRGVSSAQDIRQLRQEALTLVQLLLTHTDAPREEDVAALCSSLLSPLQDASQQADLLDLMLELLERKKGGFVKLFLKLGGHAILINLLSNPHAFIRQGSVLCLGCCMKYSKELRDELGIEKISGLSVARECLSEYPLDEQTYSCLRSMMLGRVTTLPSGCKHASEKPCRSLDTQRGNTFGDLEDRSHITALNMEVPAALLVVTRLAISNATLEVKHTLLSDASCCLKAFPAAASKIADLGWHLLVIELLATLTDTPEFVRCFPDRSPIPDSSLTGEQRHQQGMMYNVFESAMDALSRVFFEQLKEDKGWRCVDETLTLLDSQEFYFDQYEIAHMLLARIVAQYTAEAEAGTLHKTKPVILANMAYLFFFVEELLCYGTTLSHGVKQIAEEAKPTTEKVSVNPALIVNTPAEQDWTVVNVKGAGHGAVSPPAARSDKCLSAPSPGAPLLHESAVVPPSPGGLEALHPTRSTSSMLGSSFGIEKSSNDETISTDRSTSSLRRAPQYVERRELHIVLTEVDSAGNEVLAVPGSTPSPASSSASEQAWNQKETWKGWFLAKASLDLLLLCVDLYKSTEINNKEVDTEYPVKGSGDGQETRSFLGRPGGLTRLCVRFIRLCLRYHPGESLFPVPSILRCNEREGLKRVLNHAQQIIKHDRDSEGHRERFEELLFSRSSEVMDKEAKMRTTALLQALLAFAKTYSQPQNELVHANSRADGRIVQKTLSILNLILTQRVSTVQVLLGNSTEKVGLFVKALSRKTEPVISLSEGRTDAEWAASVQTFHETAVDWTATDALWLELNKRAESVNRFIEKECGAVAGDLIQRKQRTLMSLRRQVASNCDRIKDVLLKHTTGIAAKPLELPPSILPQIYRDLYRTSEKHWRSLVTAVTDQRGVWATEDVFESAARTRLVRRSRRDVGLEPYFQIRPKLSADPKLTDHSDASQNDREKAQRAEAVKVARCREETTERENSAENPDPYEAAEPAEDVEDVPELTSMGRRYPCELITLMQGWSGNLQVCGNPSRYLWLLVDEENAAIVQKMGKAEKLVEKPKDDKFSVDTLEMIFLRRYRMVYSALEFQFTDRTSILVNFITKEAAVQVMKTILFQIAPRPASLKILELPKNPMADFKKSKLTEKWVRREISNFEYLMALNHFASRSVNDLTQYPVMPWILSDYTSKEIDLEDESVYRDLSVPMGCMGMDGRRSDSRVEDLQEKYDSLYASGSEPYHYGSHYSNSGFVLFYLIRIEPYTTGSRILQGGPFDHADRMFDSMSQMWHGVTHAASDVKELIPEFFFLPEMFVNNNNVKFGHRQDGRKFSEVELPAWASSPQEFVRIHRDALESEHVSQNLHHWIDMIFGYKQSPSREGVNVYHPYTYERMTRELGNDEDGLMPGIVAHIDNFGQTPIQLLRKKHPARNAVTPIFDPFKSLASALVPQSALYSIMKSRVVKLYLTHEHLVGIGSSGAVVVHPFKAGSSVTEQQASVLLGKAQESSSLHSTAEEKNLSPGLLAAEASAHMLPPMAGSLGGASLSAGVSRRTVGSRRGFYFDPQPSCQSRPLQAGIQKCASSMYSYVFASVPERHVLISSGLWNNTAIISELVAGTNSTPTAIQTLSGHHGVVTCLALSEDYSYLVTGSQDTTLRLYRLRLKSGQPAQFQATLFGHEEPVLCVAINPTFDVIVSGSSDGTAIMYNISEGTYERTLLHPKKHPIDLITSTATGATIMYSKADAGTLFHYSLNGKLLHTAEVGAKLHTMTLTKDSHFLVCGGMLKEDRKAVSSLTLRSSHDLSLVHQFADGPAFPIRSVAVSPNNQIMAVGLEDGSLLFYTLCL